MTHSGFKGSLAITHITTATAIINVDGVNFITDPVFAPAGTEWLVPSLTLKIDHDPAISLDALPPIDAVLLSHEDHPDNLDELGRRLLDGRHVITTPDGAKNLAPRPGVRGIQRWELMELYLSGKKFKITGVPCIHYPGGECTGFIIETETFGISSDGRPNAIYVSGDTIYHEELPLIKEKWHIVAAILNFGNAHVPSPSGEIVKITMDGRDGARLVKEIGADVLVPMHFKGWGHFTEGEEGLEKAFEEEGITERVRWLRPSGQKVTIF